MAKRKKLGVDVPERLATEWNDWCDERALKRSEATIAALRFFMAQHAETRERLLKGQNLIIDPAQAATPAGESVTKDLVSVAQSAGAAPPLPAGKRRPA